MRLPNAKCDQYLVQNLYDWQYLALVYWQSRLRFLIRVVRQDQAKLRHPDGKSDFPSHPTEVLSVF